MWRTADAAPSPRGETGAAAVETALCLGVIVLPLVFAMVAYGYMLGFREALSQASAQGARAAVGATSAASAQGAAQATVTRSLRQYGMSCSGGDLLDAGGVDVGDCTTVVSPTGCTPSSGLVAVTVGTPTTPPLCDIAVRVTHRYRDHSLLPTLPLMGFTLPEQLGFTSVVTVG